MKRTVILIAVSVILSSCGVSSSLYYWGGYSNGATVYENLAYRDYKTQMGEAVCSLLCAYEDMVTHPGGTRNVPPPGICAEYGYLLLRPDTATIFAEKATSQQKSVFQSNDYAALFAERGKAMIEMELEYYPESRRFLEPLLGKLTQ